MIKMRLDTDRYLIKTENCQGHEIVCREYLAVPYVENPTAPDHQCLNIYVPVAVDGIDVNAEGVPIVFQNKISGYRSYSVTTEQRRTPRKTRFETPVAFPRIGPGEGIPGRMANAGALQFTPLLERCVLVIPGNRGKDNLMGGKWFGKAPAPIIDLKAAIRFLRFNKDRIPGDTEHIISVGSSAGGGMSALLGASGNDPEYEPYLDSVGAAKERDDVFAAVCISPIQDLEHQDMAYEWQYGRLPVHLPEGGVLPPVDREISSSLSELFEEYLNGLGLELRGGYGIFTPENYKEYHYREFIKPSAERWLRSQDKETVRVYLEDRPWIHWDGAEADFDFADYERYLGRIKRLVPFDTFEFSNAENTLFGSEDEPAAHFTEFSIRHCMGDSADISELVKAQRRLINPFTKLREGTGRVAQHWWIRNGAKECGAAVPLLHILDSQLQQKGIEANFRFAWDKGHCAEDDRPEMMQWIRKITGQVNSCS